MSIQEIVTPIRSRIAAGRKKIGRIFRLDSRGHGTEIRWEHDNQRQIDMARRTFDSYRAEGFQMYRMDDSGERGSPMTTFDPEAEGVLAVPRLQGG